MGGPPRNQDGSRNASIPVLSCHWTHPQGQAVRKGTSNHLGESSFLPIVIIMLWVAGVAVKNLPILSMAWFSASEKCEQWSWLWWSTPVMSALCMYRQHQEFEGSLHYIWRPARATGLEHISI